MKIRQDDSGFTLVEMVVSIAAGAILMVAAATMLVSAIRYTGLVYRQATLQQETIGVERVLKIAAQDATSADVDTTTNADMYSITLTGGTTSNYVFYFGGGKVYYSTYSTAPGASVPTVAESTVLSENLSGMPTLDDGSGSKLSVKLTLADSVTSAESLDACWILN